MIMLIPNCFSCKKLYSLIFFHIYRNESKFIQEIVQDISKIVQHSYLHVAKYPVGLGYSQVQNILDLHLSVGTNDVQMVGILGAPGIGKTTLAKAIYNSIVFKFDASCFLGNISDTSSEAYGLVQLQETLLSKILGDCRSLKVDNISTGINTIKRMLHSTKVLLILDDVDHLTQLETLAGGHDWFGKGSRIIITTRDEHLLTTHGVDSTYKMTGMTQDDAFKLFCLHAFKREKPDEGYGNFVEQILNYAGSLPLVLTVLGSDLYGRSESEWIHILDQYRKIPHQDIQKILRTTYERLSDNEKNIFLDIACFFIGDLFDDVVEILDIFDFCPNVWIPRLREKCLILEFDRRLQMHHLLRDMGREVVRQESPKIPGMRSRLFIPEEVCDVLEDDTGRVNVEAILVDLREGDDIIYLSPKAFENMRRLRFFKVRNAHFSGDRLESLPNGIRVIDWPKCPLQYLPPKFHGNKLVMLRMPGSLIRPIRLEFKNLTIMDFSDCEFLTKISDISSCPNLKEMHLNYCRNLVEVHDSVGVHDKLFELSLDECSNLKSFTRRLQLRSLHFLSLRGCSSLQNFPEIGCQMQYLRVIDLKGTAIEELPSSIEHVTGLVHLILEDCVNLKHLPSCLLQWKSLRWLVLDDCPNIVNFGMEAVHNGQSSPYIVSARENEASSSTELFPIPPPTNSAISLPQDSSSLRFPSLYQLDLANSGLTRFFLIKVSVVSTPFLNLPQP
ncbi:hypothetical protein I3842_15G163100 [Carya illinoinensis]|uniref:AAA+ ATPase domain-containing protein n=1 Tax=Carya illinoinensis TaxID=32201 RepID=A0A922D7T7_CARIL|nr:hypothetical protein I3842_15G163100 [Carya illinoinensis]KAG6676652.1 hypothetical protein I3842_15G163100 [Carya illinoinensis]